MEFWQRLFSGEGFPPRRLCGPGWSDSLIALHVVSDAVIFLSYLWIPLVMVWAYYAHRGMIKPRPVIVAILALYAVFITACGWTHFFDALMFYNPVYRINGIVRALTAVVSFATAVSLVKLMPHAITAPITIMTQRTALRQQFAWLKDILDGVTDGSLTLCEARADLPRPLGHEIAAIEVNNSRDLKLARQAAKDTAKAIGMEPERVHELVSVVSEAAMNGLVHAGGAQVRCCAGDGRAQIWVEDRGTGIPLDKMPIATLKRGYSSAGSAGQGWFMILSFSDSVHLLTGGEGTTVVMEMSAAAVPEPVLYPTSLGGDVATA